jgi:hypothetical protein
MKTLWLTRIFATMALLSWALWLGGMMALFIFVQTLFGRDRPLAMEAAPVLFAAFERYQLIVAVAAVASLAGWGLASGRGLIRVIFLMVGLAAAGAAAGPVLISGRMQALRAQGLSGTAEFRRLHGQSMVIYVGQALLLAGAGVLLAEAIRRDARADQESGPPGSGA